MTKREAMYERGESNYASVNGNALNYAGGHTLPERTVTFKGWEPSCLCDGGDPVPQVVLDPFAGSGTTGVVALRHGRAFVGVELNRSYVDLAVRRIKGDAPLFNQVDVCEPNRETTDIRKESA